MCWIKWLKHHGRQWQGLRTGCTISTLHGGGVAVSAGNVYQDDLLDGRPTIVVFLTMYFILHSWLAEKDAELILVLKI